MDDIERYLDNVCRSLGGPKSLRRHLREELKEHLDEAVEAFLADGLSREEAVRKAIEAFGEQAVVRGDLQAVYGRNLTALLVEKALEWKEKTMKLKWNWTFVTLVALVLVLGVQAFLIWAPIKYLIPSVLHWYEDASLPLHPDETVVLGWFRFLCFYWYVFPLGLLILWAAFELLCRSDNKPTIRLALGAWVLLAAAALGCAISISTMAMQTGLPGIVKRHHAEKSVSDILREAARAEASFVGLGLAVEAQDWPAAARAARKLERSFEHFGETGLAAPALVAAERKADIEDVRALLGEIADLSHDVQHAARVADQAETVQTFAALRESYEKVKVKVPAWPRAEPDPQPAP